MTHGDQEDWRPSATPELLRLRADWLQAIRSYFADRQVMEVDTPVLAASATSDQALASFRTACHGPLKQKRQYLYLHTSPEAFMKRLLAAGSGSIYQITRAFRDEEWGRLHNPEFTLLEWYRIGWSSADLIAEVDTLVRQLIGASLPLQATRSISYQELFLEHIAVDPMRADPDELCAVAVEKGLAVANVDGMSRDDWLHLLMSHCIEPYLGSDGPCFIYDYPACQAALAKVRDEPVPVADRFELYLHGVEIANGYSELTDAAEMELRWRQDQVGRQTRALPTYPIDKKFLAAVRMGLPDCAGVALGFDRLLMIAAGESSIEKVIPFGFAHI